MGSSRLPDFTFHFRIHCRIFRAFENLRELFQILDRTIYTKYGRNMSISFDLQVGRLVGTR